MDKTYHITEIVVYRVRAKSAMAAKKKLLRLWSRYSIPGHLRHPYRPGDQHRRLGRTIDSTHAASHRQPCQCQPSGARPLPVGMKRRRHPTRRGDRVLSPRRRSTKRLHVHRQVRRPLWLTHLVTVTICVVVLFSLSVIARLMR